MAKRPLTVSIKTTDGKEITSGTVDGILNGNLPTNDEALPVSDNVAQVIVPANVAVEVANE